MPRIAEWFETSHGGKITAIVLVGGGVVVATIVGIVYVRKSKSSQESGEVPTIELLAVQVAELRNEVVALRELVLKRIAADDSLTGRRVRLCARPDEIRQIVLPSKFDSELPTTLNVVPYDVYDTILAEKAEEERRRELAVDSAANSRTRLLKKPSHASSVTSNEDDYADANDEFWPPSVPSTEQSQERRHVQQQQQQSPSILAPPHQTTASSSSSPTMDFAAIDKLFDEFKYAEAYKLLKQAYDGGNHDAQLLYRLGRACHGQASGLDAKDKRKKELILEGLGYTDAAVKALGPDGKDLQLLKWAGILSGAASDFLGTKEKIQQGFVFKALLDRALAIDANDYALLHMRGRFAWSVANLSWLERKAASTLFAAPPEATVDEALADFLAANQAKPGWLENVLYVAKCHHQKGDKSDASKWLSEALTLEPKDDAERQLQAEARTLAAKCK